MDSFLLRIGHDDHRLKTDCGVDGQAVSHQQRESITEVAIFTWFERNITYATVAGATHRIPSVAHVAARYPQVVPLFTSNHVAAGYIRDCKRSRGRRGRYITLHSTDFSPYQSPLLCLRAGTRRMRHFSKVIRAARALVSCETLRET